MPFDDRAWNFSAGPATLPGAVIRQAREELPNWQGRGLSVMEMSHRSEEFKQIAHDAEADLRALLKIPDDYAVLFLQGGATLQFSMVPINLLAGRQQADYFRTGNWSAKAVVQAQKACRVNLAVDTKADGYRDLPEPAAWKLDPDAAYVHYTPNETIQGVEFHATPDTGDVPLVADASSMILSRPMDVARYGVIYAGAQKNIGPAGLAVAIVRRDLIGRAPENVPGMLDYRNHTEADSMYNTPPTLAWYLAGLVFRWLREQGGVEQIEQVNIRKAEKLYATIDGSDFYANPVAVHCRSRMNVPFTLAAPELDDSFLAEAEAAGLLNLKGHRAVGGMRASLYNAMPEEGVDALIRFMHDFERRKG